MNMMLNNYCKLSVIMVKNDGLNELLNLSLMHVKKNELTTTGELVRIIKKAIPAKARQDGPHPAKRTFQAIRIEVNRELAILA